MNRADMANRALTHQKRAAVRLNPRRSESTAERRTEAAPLEPLRRELVALLERRTGSDGRHETVIPQLKLYRFSHPTEPLQVLQEAAAYVVVQGRKQVTVGGERYIYDPSQYLAVAVDLPAVGNVLEATPEEPYLCMTLKVDPRELAALIVETGRTAPRDDHDGRGIYVSALRAPLLDGFLRLVRLLDTPDDVPVLAPLILRELHYRLLQSEQFGSSCADGHWRRPASQSVGGDRVDQGALCGTTRDRDTREACSHEPFCSASPLQGGRGGEPSPVSKAAAGCRRLGDSFFLKRRARNRLRTRSGTRARPSSIANT